MTGKGLDIRAMRALRRAALRPFGLSRFASQAKPAAAIAVPLLCRLRLHRWRFSSPLLTGAGSIQKCQRCGLRRVFFWAGGYIYEDRP